MFDAQSSYTARLVGLFSAAEKKNNYQVSCKRTFLGAKIFGRYLL